MKQTVYLWLFILLAAFWSCKDSEQNTPGQVRITQKNLFIDESVKPLKPHLGQFFEAFQIEYAGPKNWFWFGYEIWEQGELIYSNSPAMGGPIPLPLSGWLTVSLHKLHSCQDTVMLTSAISGDSFHLSMSRGLHPGKNSSGEESFIGEFSYPYNVPPLSSDSDAIPVWGYLVINDSNYTTRESIPDAAKQADWAFVLKVLFDNYPEKTLCPEAECR